jgi:hypothetical protein
MHRRERDELVSRLRRDGLLIAQRFGLTYREIVAENPRVKSRYGSCHEDGLIKIRLCHARTGKPLKYSSLIDTLCHELAHLRHFDHGPEFRAFFFRLLGWARRQGIYQPAPRAARSNPDPGVRPPDLPVFQGPKKRNGVPVFPEQVPEAPPPELPWEAPPSAPAKGAATRRSAPPRTPAAPALDKPEQLTLF